jgi:biopolymer transport protein ExbB
VREDYNPMTFFEEQFYALSTSFHTGGPVMVPLLLVSLVVWLLIAERWFYLRQMGRKMMSGEEAWRHIEQGEIPAAGAGGMVGLLTRRFMAERSGDLQLDKRIIDEAVQSVQRPLDRLLPLIGVLAALTPLLGLLGTVTGMMSTFKVMSLFGTGDARGMASGISEALITTETGLIIAIPAMYMKNYLEHRAQQIGEQLVSTGYFLRRHLHGKESE